MISIKRIVCPTDFSQHAARALDHAIAVARWYDAEITALHVVPRVLPPSAALAAYPALVPLAPTGREQIERALHDALEPARRAGVRTRLEVREGDAAEETLLAAQGLTADMLVLGTHGHGGFRRLLLGSVTEKVLRRAPCPVLSIAPHAHVAAADGALVYKTILCPIDFSEPSMHALRYALSLAQEANARLIVVHVIEGLYDTMHEGEIPIDLSAYSRFVNDDARRRLRDAIPQEAREWCTPEEVVTSGRAYAEILRFATEKSADLIVMGVHGRSAFDMMFFGSSTNHVVRSATCPVLVIRTT